MLITRAFQIQSIALLAYGLVLFFIPDWYQELFDWEGTDTILGRVIGASFLGLGWVEWSLANRATRSTALPFALVPTLLVIGFLWELGADTFEGTDSWFWTNFAVSAAFALLLWGAVVTAED